MDYEYLSQQYPKIISMDQLYRICHISKRKAKWLLENGVIPCKDSGKQTRRFQICLDDVITFLERREAGLLHEDIPAGIFSSGGFFIVYISSLSLVLLLLGGAAFLEEVMFFHPGLIDLLDILNSEDRPVVRVLRVLPAVVLIGVDLVQHLNKLLLRVVDVPEQFVVEVQYPRPVAVGGTPVIRLNVGVQLFLNAAQAHGVPSRLCQPGPGVQLDGGNLH